MRAGREAKEHYALTEFLRVLFKLNIYEIQPISGILDSRKMRHRHPDEDKKHK